MIVCEEIKIPRAERAPTSGFYVLEDCCKTMCWY